MTTPGSGLKVEKRTLKGVDSFGMLCSAHDIGWSKEADGKLVVLPEDVKVGAPCPDKPPKVRLGWAHGDAREGDRAWSPSPVAGRAGGRGESERVPQADRLGKARSWCWCRALGCRVGAKGSLCVSALFL